MDKPRHLIGTAGWIAPRTLPEFGGEGGGLERYAKVFRALEINTSFYRRHRPATWQRWHDAVPDDFRFSVKLPRTITHEKELAGAEEEIGLFFEDVAPLGRKLGVVLVQLPPKLGFDSAVAEAFLRSLRERSCVSIFIEPRHASWAEAAASALLRQFDIGRVLADPQGEPLRAAAEAGPSCYLRLHGTPRIYYSSYDDAALARYADYMSAAAGPCWCIFDNTASGAAVENALRFKALLDQRA